MSQVSVIIPCFNHSRFLAQAIRSALAQTLRPIEVIVVDDGSTDDTAQVAASFGDSIRYIYQSNGGLSSARNAGIRAATGDYLGLLDADDLWLADFLSTLVPILDRNADLAAVYSGSQFIDGKGKPLPQKITRTAKAHRLYDTLIGGEFFPPCAVLVRKSAFDKVGLFDESLQASEDWDMWLRVSANFLFAGVPQVLALYRMHGDNMSRDLGRMLVSQLRVAEKHFGPAKGEPNTWPGRRQRAFAGIYLWHAWTHYQRGESNLGLEYLSRAFISYPAVSHQLDTFYMLACSDQPPGYMGDLANLDLDQNANRLIMSLNLIFSDPQIPTRLRSERSDAYGMAYFALGILAYSKRQLRKARHYLVNAVLSRPTLLMDGQWVLTFVKSLLGKWLLSTLIEWKHARSARTSLIKSH